VNSIQSVVHTAVELLSKLARAMVVGKGWLCSSGEGRQGGYTALESLLKTLSDQWGAGRGGVAALGSVPNYPHIYI